MQRVGDLLWDAGKPQNSVSILAEMTDKSEKELLRDTNRKTLDLARRFCSIAKALPEFEIDEEKVSF